MPDYMLYNHAHPLPPTTPSGHTPWLGQHMNSTGDLASFFKSKRREAIQQKVNLRQLMAGHAQVQQGTVGQSCRGQSVHRHQAVRHTVKGLMIWHLDCTFQSTVCIIVFFTAKLYRALVQECNQSLLCFLMSANDQL